MDIDNDTQQEDAKVSIHKETERTKRLEFCIGLKDPRDRNMCMDKI